MICSADLVLLAFLNRTWKHFVTMIIPDVHLQDNEIYMYVWTEYFVRVYLHKWDQVFFSSLEHPCKCSENYIARHWCCRCLSSVDKNFNLLFTHANWQLPLKFGCHRQNTLSSDTCTVWWWPICILFLDNKIWSVFWMFLITLLSAYKNQFLQHLSLSIRLSVKFSNTLLLLHMLVSILHFSFVCAVQNIWWGNSIKEESDKSFTI